MNNILNPYYDGVTNSRNIDKYDYEDQEYLWDLTQLKDEEIRNINDIVDKPKEKLQNKVKSGSEKYLRDPKEAILALKNAKYKCEIDNNHESFISQKNYNNYVEAHHLIPIQYYNKFNVSLDVSANIICLCPNCHKKLHYGIFNDNKDLIIKLYNDRKKRLESCGIFIKLKELLDMYK